jgi:transposase-like protein
MSEPPRQYSTELKEEIVLRLEAGERVAAVAAETGIRRKLLYQWRHAYRAKGVAGLNRKRGRKPGSRLSGSSALRAPASPSGSSGALSADELTKAKARIAELERIVGRQQVDIDFFQRALRLWDATSPSGGVPTSTRSSKR